MNFDDFPPPKTDFSAPPPYEANFSAPPSITLNIPENNEASLPTYEEVEFEKSLELMPPPFQPHPLPPPQLPEGITRLEQPITFLSIETNNDNTNSSNDNSLLGTDLMFVCAFTIAFIFNWIGFLLLTCFCHSVASRYGALAGFGLSLAKWTFIVKHSTELASHENSWLWWLIMAFGFLICIRAFVQYISIKKTWRLLSVSAQERLLFFY
ncbi:NDFIP1 family protein [Megaselia abdita]